MSVYLCGGWGCVVCAFVWWEQYVCGGYIGV